MSKKRFGRFKFNGGDYAVLCILAVLLVLFVFYLSRKNSEIDKAVASGNLYAAQALFVAQKDSTYEALPKDTVKNKVPSDPVRTNRYPGPPQRVAYVAKLQPGEQIDLNGSDTTALMSVPGIGTAFARRIAKYRQLLGGYYCVEQLQEVYGMDRDRYDKIAPFFVIKTAVDTIYYDLDSVARHPYLNWKHKNAIMKVVKENPPLTWEKLMKQKVFSRDDSLRLAPYFKH